ncbi:hypothetical protein N9Y89_00650 [bacterium]|nr:hypothetical protein [bacterium]
MNALIGKEELGMMKDGVGIVNAGSYLVKASHKVAKTLLIWL